MIYNEIIILFILEFLEINRIEFNSEPNPVVPRGSDPGPLRPGPQPCENEKLGLGFELSPFSL